MVSAVFVADFTDSTRAPQVLGVADEDVARDYSLTTDGLEPVRSILIEHLKKQPAYAENPEGTMAMGSSR